MNITPPSRLWLSRAVKPGKGSGKKRKPNRDPESVKRSQRKRAEAVDNFEVKEYLVSLGWMKDCKDLEGRGGTLRSPGELWGGPGGLWEALGSSGGLWVALGGPGGR